MGLDRILIVDDEGQVLDVLRAMLEQAGYRVSTAMSGGEGLYRFDREAPDLVILDVAMPDMDGFSVLEAIRTRERCVPVLMLTGHASLRDAQEDAAGPPDAFLGKPVSRKLLLETVSYLLTWADACETESQPRESC